MQIRIKGELLHTHPHEEKKYGLDKDHVIIDKAAFVAVIQEVQELRGKILKIDKILGTEGGS